MDILALFDLALKKYGRVDCAVSNAGAMEQGSWVNVDLNLESIKEVSWFCSFFPSPFCDLLKGRIGAESSHFGCELAGYFIFCEDCTSLSETGVERRR